MTTLTPAQSRLMDRLQSGDPTTLATITSATNLRGAALTKVLNALTARDLITIKDDTVSLVRKRHTKRMQLVDLLTDTQGKSTTSLAKSLGWQPHTLRAALTRLRQAGRQIEKLPPHDGETGARYRITA